jgi:hypothetical protein
MDPVTTLNKNLLRDDITRDFTELFNLILEGNDEAAREHIQQLANRTHGIPQAVLETRNFTFTVPEHSLEEIFTWNLYTRPKPMVHYRIEDDKNYYNANEAYLAYRDPDSVAFIEQATAEANGNNDQNQLQRIYNQAKKAQMEQNTAAEAEAPDWVLCQRTKENDYTLEDTYIRYTDETKRNIDWFTTIHNLHDMGRRLGYTHRHYYDAMARFVSFFKPSLSSLITDLDANETAQFLMSMNIPISGKQKYLKAIKSLHRNIGTKLSAIIYELHVNAKGYYADNPETQQPALINNIMVQGLQAFTTGDTNVKLRAFIQQQTLENQLPNWEYILEAAILSEESLGMPTTVLHLQPNTLALPVNAMPLFNITAQELDRSIQPGTPLIAPSVSGGQFQSEFYTNEHCFQSQAHAKAYFIQPNPIMHVQPRLQQNNILAEAIPTEYAAHEQELQSNDSVPPTGTSGSPIVADTVTATILNQMKQISKELDKLQQIRNNNTTTQSLSPPSVPCSAQSYSQAQSPQPSPGQYRAHKRTYQHEEQYKFRSSSPSYKKYRWDSPGTYPGSNSQRGNYGQNQQRTSRKRSPSPYMQNMPQHDGRAKKMILGVNCNPNYSKTQGHLCTKCNSYGQHEEHACPHYYRWSPMSCGTCHNGMHDPSECLKNRPISPNRRSPTPNYDSDQKN